MPPCPTCCPSIALRQLDSTNKMSRASLSEPARVMVSAKVTRQSDVMPGQKIPW